MKKLTKKLRNAKIRFENKLNNILGRPLKFLSSELTTKLRRT